MFSREFSNYMGLYSCGRTYSYVKNTSSKQRTSATPHRTDAEHTRAAPATNAYHNDNTNQALLT